MNQGLLNYSHYLQQESNTAIALYREFIKAILHHGEQLPIPEYTLECLRQAAWDSINNWRLVQIAMVGSICDPETQRGLVDSCERIEALDNENMGLLGTFHQMCLESLNENTV